MDKEGELYTMEYYSAIRKNEILPFASTWLELENIILTEISQTEKDNYYISLISRMYMQMNVYAKQKQTHRCRKQISGY